MWDLPFIRHEHEGVKAHRPPQERRDVMTHPVVAQPPGRSARWRGGRRLVRVVPREVVVHASIGRNHATSQNTFTAKQCPREGFVHFSKRTDAKQENDSWYETSKCQSFSVSNPRINVENIRFDNEVFHRFSSTKIKNTRFARFAAVLNFLSHFWLFFCVSLHREGYKACWCIYEGLNCRLIRNLLLF